MDPIKIKTNSEQFDIRRTCISFVTALKSMRRSTFNIKIVAKPATLKGSGQPSTLKGRGKGKPKFRYHFF